MRACMVTFPPAFIAVTSYSCNVNTMIFIRDAPIRHWKQK